MVLAEHFTAVVPDGTSLMPVLRARLEERVRDGLTHALEGAHDREFVRALANDRELVDILALAPARELESAMELALELDRALAPLALLITTIGHDCVLASAYPRDRGRAFAQARQLDFALVHGDEPDRGTARVRALALARVRALQDVGAAHRQHAGTEVPQTWGTKTQNRAVAWLARLLPAGERSRFVAEEQSNLGACERWWQRVDCLVMLAIGTPRLAWLMRREGRRRRV